MTSVGLKALRRMADLQVLGVADRWSVASDAVVVRCAGVDCPALRDLVRLRSADIVDPAPDLFRDALEELGGVVSVPIDAVRRRVRHLASAVMEGEMDPATGFLESLAVCDAIPGDLPPDLEEFGEDSTRWMERRANRNTEVDVEIERAEFLAVAQRALLRVSPGPPGVDRSGQPLSAGVQWLFDQHSLGLFGDGMLPWVAGRALADGIRTPALEQLAALGRIDADKRNRTGQLVRKALTELGLEPSEPGEAVLRLAAGVASDILECRVSPLEGATEIVRFDGGRSHEPDPYIHPFIYAWSEWSERPPDHHGGLRKMVFDGARDLVEHVRLSDFSNPKAS